MPENEKFFSIAEAVNPKDHYFIPHRLNQEQLKNLIQKNITLFSTRLVKAEKQQLFLSGSDN